MHAYLVIKLEIQRLASSAQSLIVVLHPVLDGLTLHGKANNSRRAIISCDELQRTGGRCQRAERNDARRLHCFPRRWTLEPRNHSRIYAKEMVHAQCRSQRHGSDRGKQWGLYDHRPMKALRRARHVCTATTAQGTGHRRHTLVRLFSRRARQPTSNLRAVRTLVFRTAGAAGGLTGERRHHPHASAHTRRPVAHRHHAPSGPNESHHPSRGSPKA